MADTLQTDPVQHTSSAVEVASTAKDKAVDVAGSAGDEAKAVARDAVDHAWTLIDETRQQLRGQAAEQTDRLSDTLRDVADQLRGMIEGRGAAPGMMSDLASQLASTASRAATRLDQGGFDTALDDAKRFARNRPGTFLAVAVGAGFMAGRLIKALDTHALAQAAKPASGDDQSAMNEFSSVGGAPVHGTIGGGSSPLASDPYVLEP